MTSTNNIPNILRFGLRPKPGGTFKDPLVGSKQPRVYLSESPDDILTFVSQYLGSWTLLEVEVEDAKLHPDPYEPGHYYTTKRIPQNSIQVVRTKVSED